MFICKCKWWKTLAFAFAIKLTRGFSGSCQNQLPLLCIKTIHIHIFNIILCNPYQQITDVRAIYLLINISIVLMHIINTKQILKLQLVSLSIGEIVFGCQCQFMLAINPICCKISQFIFYLGTLPKNGKMCEFFPSRGSLLLVTVVQRDRSRKWGNWAWKWRWSCLTLIMVRLMMMSFPLKARYEMIVCQICSHIGWIIT